MDLEKFNLLSLNVRGLRNFDKHKAVFRWLKLKKADIIFLQETHTTAAEESKWWNLWDGPSFFSYGSSNSRGCSILIPTKLILKF